MYHLLKIKEKYHFSPNTPFLPSRPGLSCCIAKYCSYQLLIFKAKKLIVVHGLDRKKMTEMDKSFKLLSSFLNSICR